MIIGITGTLGAGKGAIVEYLAQKGFRHYSVREFLTEEINKRSLPINRDSMVLVANQLREINSPSYIIEKLMEKAKQEGGNSIIESVRTQGEAEKIKEGGILLAIDADLQIRYSRISGRQSETDRISFERFREDERREIFSTDPNKQNLSACIKMADFVLNNDGTLEDLHRQIEEVYRKIILEKGQERKLEEQKRLSWDDYFMKIAAVIAERSTCHRHNIGAIIVKDKRVLTTGYNGAARGVDNCLKLGCLKDERKIAPGTGHETCRAIHAEQNAIIQAGLHGIKIDDSKMYCTHTPCGVCAKIIVNAGIKEVYSYHDYSDEEARNFLIKAGVKLVKLQKPTNTINFKD